MALYEFEGKRPVIPASCFIHPQAVIIGEVVLGENCYVGAGAVLRGDYGKIVIGSGSNIQENSLIHSRLMQRIIRQTQTNVSVLFIRKENAK